MAVSTHDSDFGTPEWHTRQCEETIEHARETGDYAALKYVVMDASLGRCGDEGARLIADVSALGEPGQDIVDDCIDEMIVEREDAKDRGYPDVVRRREEILSVFHDASEIELGRKS